MVTPDVLVRLAAQIAAGIEANQTCDADWDVDDTAARAVNIALAICRRVKKLPTTRSAG